MSEIKCEELIPHCSFLQQKSSQKPIPRFVLKGSISFYPCVRVQKVKWLSIHPFTYVLMKLEPILGDFGHKSQGTSKQTRVHTRIHTFGRFSLQMARRHSLWNVTRILRTRRKSTQIRGDRANSTPEGQRQDCNRELCRRLQSVEYRTSEPLTCLSRPEEFPLVFPPLQ